jgi:spore maturation protein CgeB
MKVVLFSHSLLSDWNHGNAHFLRGIVTELCARGHRVHCYEPADGWSVQNLLSERGPLALAEVRRVYPRLEIERYALSDLDLAQALDGADVVIVHEWNEPELVARIGRVRASGARFKLLFHDTHHRSITDAAAMGRYDLTAYDGVLAFGEAIRQVYLREGWARRVWTWHEAADVRVFKPMEGEAPAAELVWIGNWGDGERSSELEEFLLEPVRALQLRATVHGVRYPEEGKEALAASGIEYRGWLPNYKVPLVFSRHRVTVHVPRRPYATALRGIPTIRPFEALACGIPLISAPWDDAESLFRPGDFLWARTGEEMKAQLRNVLSDAELASELAARGRSTILERHTCAHRVDELLGMLRSLDQPDDVGTARAAAANDEAI